ncbi:hypothetical protein [Arthrobacter sp. YN]|uniref:hypothetical protein n=1 Tax=Arthrobacter sp. YN TaxID=2020486 RepID=UPI0012FE2C29|nr:hypothetical protein [Arthrobacter sp. YN]
MRWRSCGEGIVGDNAFDLPDAPGFDLQLEGGNRQRLHLFIEVDFGTRQVDVVIDGCGM